MIEISEKKIKNFNMIGQRATLGMVLFEIAKKMDDLMVCTADVSTSAGLDRYRKTYPEKYIDVGISEQNLMGIATGLASENYKVLTTTFAPFQTMRCLEQIKVNLGYMKHKVTMVGLASGLVLGTLGYTHCAIEDLSIMRSIPNITVISPADCLEVAKAIIAALNHHQSTYIRLTGSSNMPKVYSSDYNFIIGEPIEIIKGEDITIFATGTMVANAVEASKLLNDMNIFPSVVNVHTLKPINKEKITQMILNSKKIFTIEEHSIIGGLSSTIAEINTTIKSNVTQSSIAIPNEYDAGGPYDFLKEKNFLTALQISERIKSEL
mgnify:FL=1|jgi:transketolase|tara:strand:+ start:14925 stop:15890 length:966 start_codon:yes stop_codon:yes gene_type:complete